MNEINHGNDQILTWQEKLFMKGITGEENMDRLPPDIDQSLNYLIDPQNSFLTVREEKALRLRYQEDLGISEIAVKLTGIYGKNISVSQTTGILSKALQKLRHPKCMRYMLLGVNLARTIEKKRKDYRKQIEEDETWASAIKEYNDETLQKLLTLRKRIDRIIEQNYLTFRGDSTIEQVRGTRIDAIGLPKQTVKSLMSKGIVKTGDLIGKTEAEVRQMAKLTYEELHKLKKSLKGLGITVQ